MEWDLLIIFIVYIRRRVCFMNKKLDYSLYLVTDRSVLGNKSLEESIKNAILGGVTVVQLREKMVSSMEFYNIALKVKAITDKYNVPLIINDRLDIALAVDAAGVHVGQKDLPAKVVRKVLGDKKILGVSTATVKEAIKAEKDGADYLGIGSVFQTSTKKDARNISVDKLREVKEFVNIPAVAIGGVNESNVSKLKGTNIDGIAVISAILGKDDVGLAATNLKNIFLEGR